VVESTDRTCSDVDRDRYTVVVDIILCQLSEKRVLCSFCSVSIGRVWLMVLTAVNAVRQALGLPREVGTKRKGSERCPFMF
jgi:hypothetical protein